MWGLGGVRTFAWLGAVVVLACSCGPAAKPAVPELEVQPASLDFGDVAPGGSVERTVTLLNRGTALLTFSGLSVTGTDASAFSISGLTPPSLAEGVSGQVKLVFRPTRVGAHTAQFIVKSDASNGAEMIVPLAGTSGQPVVDAGSVDAGTDDAGVVDAGADDAGVSDAGVSDAGVSDAGVADAGSFDAGSFDAGSVDAGASCNVTPSGWSTPVTPWANNPVLLPATGSAMHGSDNVYAPDIQHVMGRYVMFYGGQGGDGHDRIFMAWSKDRVEWRKWPSDTAPTPVLDRGTSNHVNDPSLVIVSSGSWAMYYTDAATGTDDRIWLARNTVGNTNSLTAFTKVQQVLSVGAAGAWDSDNVGRPSVLLENGVYKMWFDGTHAGQRHVGYATSTDGLTFTKHAANPLVLNAGAVDVKKIGGVYVMVAEGQDGTYWYTSPDGVCWASKGRLFGLSGRTYDAFGQVTPFLEVENGALSAVWFGGASVVTWNRNRLAVAFPTNVSLPAGGGCTACVGVGQSCPSACISGGAASSGTCGAPGSTSAGVCCACQSEGCDACKGTAADCNAKCVGTGKAGGWCSFPGSTNVGMCCGCLE